MDDRLDLMGDPRGNKWFREGVTTLAHIRHTKHRCWKVQGGNEAELIRAYGRLRALHAEAVTLFEKKTTDKRLRKRGAALRHRANAIYNRFKRRVREREEEDRRKLREALSRKWDRPIGGVVLFYPHAIIKAHI